MFCIQAKTFIFPKDMTLVCVWFENKRQKSQLGENVTLLFDRYSWKQKSLECRYVCILCFFSPEWYGWLRLESALVILYISSMKNMLYSNNIHPWHLPLWKEFPLRSSLLLHFVIWVPITGQKLLQIVTHFLVIW